MTILVNKDMGVIVQGITGRQGSFHTKLMLEYGTKVVAGVTPGGGGQKLGNVPVYNSVREALEDHEAQASILFVPAPNAKQAVLEAMENMLGLIVVITEHIPIHDVLEFREQAKICGARIVGPNTPGIMVPTQCKVGIMPPQIFTHGKVGVVSRSGTLTYEIVYSLTKNGLGQSTCVGIGGDPVIGMSFIDILGMFERDPETEGIVLIGEIGGTAEEEAAEFIGREVTKPVVAFVAGQTAPLGKRMGHAGAIIEGERGSAKSKIEVFRGFNIPVAKTPIEVVENIRSLL